MQRIHKGGILTKISDSARGHVELAEIYGHRWSPHSFQENLITRAAAFHLHLYRQLNSMFDCVASDSSRNCDAGLNWDDAIHQLDQFKISFQRVEASERYPVAWNVYEWIEKEYRLFLELVKLEQWMSRPIITPFDSSTLCPANYEVDDVFYDCPVGAEETLVFQSKANQDDSFLCFDTHTKELLSSFDAMKQNIKASAIHGATATFIIEMVGYCSKRAGCSDRAVNIISTSTGFAIALYTGSFLSSIAYVGSKQLALFSGLSERNAGRVALSTEAGVRFARNFTLPGIVETSVCMAASYGGALAGSGLSFFARKALDSVCGSSKPAREYALSSVKVD